MFDFIVNATVWAVLFWTWRRWNVDQEKVVKRERLLSVIPFLVMALIMNLTVAVAVNHFIPGVIFAEFK